jgi:hypothetical protein
MKNMPPHHDTVKQKKQTIISMLKVRNLNFFIKHVRMDHVTRILFYSTDTPSFSTSASCQSSVYQRLKQDRAIAEEQWHPGTVLVGIVRIQRGCRLTAIKHALTMHYPDKIRSSTIQVRYKSQVYSKENNHILK